MNETDVTLSEAKQKALATLNANQKHQAALVEYISRLTANIHQADLVIVSSLQSSHMKILIYDSGRGQ